VCHLQIHISFFKSRLANEKKDDEKGLGVQSKKCKTTYISTKVPLAKAVEPDHCLI